MQRIIFLSFFIGVSFMSIKSVGQVTYTLCTSVSDLSAGSKYIIASAQSGTANVLGYQNTNNRPKATTSYTVSSSTITATPATSVGDMVNAYEITLGGSSGAWSLYDAATGIYLQATSSASNFLKSGSGLWTISFAANAAVITCTNGGSNNILRYNSTANLFSCYSSGQNAVYLYKASTTTNTLATDYFRSRQNGDWNNTSTWESSHTGSGGWINADLVPGLAASDVYISHTVSITTNITINKARVAATLLLLNGAMSTTINGNTYSGTYNGVLNLYDGGAADELTILNAGKLQAVSTSATYNTAVQYNTSGNINVNTGGAITIGDGGSTHSVGGYSGFGTETSSHIIWNHYSIFEWNSTGVNGLGTAGLTYFPSVNSSTIPILKVSKTMGGTWGAATATVINGLLEIDAANTLKNAGSKTIRDGITGTATLTLDATVGTTTITSSSAVLDGSGLTLKLNQPLTVNGIVVPSGANVKVDNTSTSSIILNNKTFNVDAGGTFDIGSAATLSGAGNVTISGTFKTANAGGFSGASSSIPTATVAINSGSTIEYNATGNQTFTSRADYSGITISGANTSKKIMNGNATASGSLTLTSGVLVTNDYLFTWGNGGALTQPATYTDSYICTCDAAGKETTVKDGTAGFRINNVGGNSDVFFPVGTDYVSPNRMAINMNGSTADNFTVVVGKGDIGNTPWPKVSRIWYVKEGTAGASTATMKLYFTERDASQFLTGQDEVETGFDYSKITLIQKDIPSNTNFVNASAGTDIQSFPYGSYNNKEVYALYTIGISPDVNNTKNGINTFSRFAIVGNASGIILPVSVTGLKAYQKGNTVQVEWTALNETSIDHYEVEKSANATSFVSISNVKAHNNGSARIDYFVTDNNPDNGKNYYRIKIFDKYGKISSTAIVMVDLKNEKVSIAVLPNPVKNKKLTLALNNIPAGKYQVVLYSISGQKVYQQSIEHAGGVSSQNIQLPAAINHGVYVLKVLNNATNFNEKVLIE